MRVFSLAVILLSCMTCFGQPKWAFSHPKAAEEGTAADFRETNKGIEYQGETYARDHKNDLPGYHMYKAPDGSRLMVPQTS